MPDEWWCVCDCVLYSVRFRPGAKLHSRRQMYDVLQINNYYDGFGYANECDCRSTCSSSVNQLYKN